MKHAPILLTTLGVLSILACLCACSSVTEDPQFLGRWKDIDSNDTIELSTDSGCIASFEIMIAEQPSKFEVSEGTGPGIAYKVLNPAPYTTTLTAGGVDYEIALQELSVTPSYAVPKVQRLPDGSKKSVMQTWGRQEVRARWRLESDGSAITIYVTGKAKDATTKEFPLFSLAVEKKGLKLSHGVLTAMEEGYYSRQK